VGKSLFMCHHAAACLMQNRNVLYITLEMAEERIAERIDANIMDITMDELQDLPLEMYEKRLKGATRGVSGKFPTSFSWTTSTSARLRDSSTATTSTRMATSRLSQRSCVVWRWRGMFPS
jgi:hypothetical protein